MSDDLTFRLDAETGERLTAAAVGVGTTPLRMLRSLVSLVTDPHFEVAGLPQLAGEPAGQGRVLVRARVDTRTLARLTDAADHENVGVAGVAGRLVAAAPPFALTAAARAERLATRPADSEPLPVRREHAEDDDPEEALMREWPTDRTYDCPFDDPEVTA